MATREPLPFDPTPPPARLLIPVDVPTVYASAHLDDDLAYLAQHLVTLLAAGVSRRTIERRLTRDWPAQGEVTP